MALVKAISKRLDIPNEPDEFIVIRKLSWRELDAAEAVATKAAFFRMRDMGGDVLRAMKDWDKTQDADRSAKYDRGLLLQTAIIDWSYPDDISPETVDLLDVATADWLIGEILALAAPPEEEDRKNV